ncbi:hypothetical protein [Limnohabitans sp. T6-5]|uniref:hypothetical protein n=1 Tax=Limnohabitans sp. T6-5 TaxID=1100724 RepID=UPI0011B1D57B|nr:hypothetical protein [Limnohabitans sp. T6-5]
MTFTAFNKFMQRVLTTSAPLLKCMGCGKPGAPVCPGCLRIHNYVREVEQRRSSSPTGRSA